MQRHKTKRRECYKVCLIGARNQLYMGKSAEGYDKVAQSEIDKPKNMTKACKMSNNLRRYTVIQK